MIGAIASISQLVLYIKNVASDISALRRELRDAPSRIQQHTDDLASLKSIIDFITDDCRFQTRIVETHLNLILKRISNLRTILGNNLELVKQQSTKKFWKAAHINKGEEQILKSFAALEKDKSNLLLCITGINSEILQHLHQSVIDKGMCFGEKEGK